MDCWKTTFLLGRPIIKGYVSFREGIVQGNTDIDFVLEPRVLPNTSVFFAEFMM